MGNMPFDFSNVIKELAARGVNVQNVIRAQQAHFSGLRVDWQSLLNLYFVD